ncbi:MAG TPA: 16S rRNA (cytidine(1402)-2'-O)-methyltransferase [Syntrophomonas sp.]|nr:16S rRNA (cytidine(1402)-2'-O)-methyltransferase [Syntrophomonas sp.]HRW12828.1 16S rRNA (cytidine(1402)-2'-O)-methyltransferase [Syntrophomonas sp.]
MQAGTLYVCGTPIGNLEDVSIRLLKTLRRVDLIACEDTRNTIKLLNHYKIKKPLTSYHQYSGNERENHLLAKLLSGKSIALVTDAGMPGISDPGPELVKKAIAADIKMEVIPGPSALTAALAISGLDSSSFIFYGFLPRQRSQRRNLLMELTNETRTAIFYEAPHRLLSCLEDMQEVLGQDQPLMIGRELTKKYQEMQRGTIGGLLAYYQKQAPRGEICLLLPGRQKADGSPSLEQIAEETRQLIKKGLDKKEAFKMKAREYQIKKSDLYNYFLDYPE